MQYIPYPDFYILDDNEVEINNLMCPNCGRTAEDMYDECDTVLHCPCGKSFYHVIWDSLEDSEKKHSKIYIELYKKEIKIQDTKISTSNYTKYELQEVRNQINVYLNKIKELEKLL